MPPARRPLHIGPQARPESRLVAAARLTGTAPSPSIARAKLTSKGVRPTTSNFDNLSRKKRAQVLVRKGGFEPPRYCYRQPFPDTVLRLWTVIQAVVVQGTSSATVSPSSDSIEHNPGTCGGVPCDVVEDDLSMCMNVHSEFDGGFVIGGLDFDSAVNRHVFGVVNGGSPHVSSPSCWFPSRRGARPATPLGAEAIRKGARREAANDVRLQSLSAELALGETTAKCGHRWQRSSSHKRKRTR